MEEKKTQELEVAQLEKVAGGAGNTCAHDGGVLELASPFVLRDRYGAEHVFVCGYCDKCRDKVYKQDGKLISEKQYNDAWNVAKYQ